MEDRGGRVAVAASVDGLLQKKLGSAFRTKKTGLGGAGSRFSFFICC